MTESPAGPALEPLPGLKLWPGRLAAAAQAALRDAVRVALGTAPPYRPVTPCGRPMSVRMSNLGPLGWVADR
ncbi:MAG: alpha-ketoglutarate-dependent dioxygenase AlkB, partial [Brevundimonas sp.]